MTFGTTVAAYNKKPNPYLAKQLVPSGGIQSTATSTVSPSVGDTKASQPATPVAPIKTALGGSTAPVASNFVNNVQSPIYQPLFSGQMGDKSNSIYGRLNAINQTTASLDEATNTKVAIQNQRINAFNQRVSQDQSISGTFGGNGGYSGLDAEQLDNAKAIANIGKQRGMSEQGIQIALMTALTESGLRNLNHGDRDSVGLFQQRTSQGWGSVDQIMNRDYSAGKFFDALGKTNYAAMQPWQAAQAVQRSFDPTGSNYQKQYALAQQAYKAIFQPAATSNQASNWINQNNNKYIDYDGAYGAQCVDLYNAYTAGFVGGKNYMVGYAPEIFSNYDANAYTRLGGTQTSGRMGDVAVFKPGGSTPSGHVAIVVGDNGNGTLRVLQANATPAGSAGNTIISNISKSTLMGYLRPNKLG